MFRAARHRGASPFDNDPGGSMYIFVTAVLAILITGFGVGFAFANRLPDLDD